MFSGALQFIDNLHFDQKTRYIHLEPDHLKLKKAFEDINTVFKSSKLNSILEHFAEILPEDDESYWEMELPPLPEC